MHKLLERQLRKYLGDATPAGPKFEAFLRAVDEAYTESDSGQALLERSIELTSSELLERNTRLERDLASIKRLELELRQAEKLRAVGQLAAGVAHEINTPIQYVGDSVHFMKGACQDLLTLGQVLHQVVSDAVDPTQALEQLRLTVEEIDLEYLLQELPKALEQTSDGVRRVAGIVSALKDFGRPDSRDKTLADVNRCLETTLLIAQNELKYVAKVELELGILPLVPCYPGELNQVLLNLLVNAAHAVAARFRGSEQLGLIRAVTALRSECVVVTVSDNGIGILPEHQGRIFEPFFTTKSVGAGTGQGLAIARSIIVEKHGGSLGFESVPGEGTSFSISLPLGEPLSQPSLSRRFEAGVTP
ncbi:MAG TPA: ATP-binding protein [Polyangiaceae bacterium]